MYDHTVIAIDLAKIAFHACTISKHNKIITQRQFNRTRLMSWLIKQPRAIVAMESCGSAHYWARFAKRHGHQVKLLSPQAVKAYRQGHKTDANDAVAIAIAARQPNVKPVTPKTIEQQGLQGIERMRKHHSDTKTAQSNLIRGLLFEFGITIPQGDCSLKRDMADILEDAENELPISFREQLADMYQCFLKTEQALIKVEMALMGLIKSQPDCQALMAIEGIGPINALGLSLALGERGQSFANGREAAACIGVTPKQHSTGGKAMLGTIGKYCGKQYLRSTIIQGAMAVAKVVQTREPRTTKELWLKQLIERSSLKSAAVALANKNIRTAWAVLNSGQPYQRPRPLVA